LVAVIFLISVAATAWFGFHCALGLSRLESDMKILVVMVRYKKPFSESLAFNGLSNAFSSHPELAKDYTVLIWDNSPETIVNPQLPISFLYRGSKTNVGVSGAYNGAMEYALEHGYPWMLLLDQDTKITSEILVAMRRHSLSLLPRQEIAAIAPTVRVGSTVVSPKRLILGRGRNYPAGECGIAPGEASVINSGCLVRVASLREIGGYSPDFWLDFSDMYVFHQFFVHGKRVWRATDVELEHELSVMDYDSLMTPWRCRNFVSAETAFNDVYNGRLQNSILTLQLFARAIKHRLKHVNPEFWRIAWDQYIFRLRVPRTERIARRIAEREKRVVQRIERSGETDEAVLP
jgi:GT2 family glycosyltransferase